MVKAEQAGKNGEKLANHRVRQSNFNLECLKSLKRQNQGWTLLIDSDEYLLTNNYIDNGTLSTTSVPELLGEIHIPNVTSFYNSYSPCLPIHRIQYSAHESNITHVENQEVIPSGFHGIDFQTMRVRNNDATEGLQQMWETCTHVPSTKTNIQHDFCKVFKKATLSSKGLSTSPKISCSNPWVVDTITSALCILDSGSK